MVRKNLWAAFSLGILTLCGCRVEDDALPPAVEGFDPERYMGSWYEIARTPNPFEKDLKDVTALYTLQKDGSISVLNRGLLHGKVKEIRGFAKMRFSPEKGDLLVSFFRPFYFLYRIVLLGKDYQYSVVISSGGKYLWILAREKTLSDGDRKEIRDFLEKWKLLSRFRSYFSKTHSSASG